MEWHAFTQRSVRPLAESAEFPTQSFIVPVIWVPIPSPVPDYVSLRKMFSPRQGSNRSTHSQYQQNGICDLMQMTDLRNSCFHQRAARAGSVKPRQRFMPVLWAPLLTTQSPPRFEQTPALKADKPGYTQNGLRALLKISSYRDSYPVVDEPGQQIAILAENSPMTPSEVPDIDEVESVFTPGPLGVFSIQVAAPTVHDLPAGHDPSTYGVSSTEWRPFPLQNTPIAEYARQTVERFDFKAEVSEISANMQSRSRRPGIILIDPWIIAQVSGRSTLESAVRKLPRWILPLLILTPATDGRSLELADKVRDILRQAKALPTDSSRRGAQGVGSLDAFRPVIRALIAEAERQYIRYRGGQQASQRQTRPPSYSPSRNHGAQAGGFVLETDFPEGRPNA